MDMLQLFGDYLHLLGGVILLLKLLLTKNCAGISGKTQILFALVFTMRYLDLPLELQVSLLSFVIKIIYLFVIYLTVTSIVVIFKKSYNQEYDTFRFELLIGVSIVLALLASYKKWEPLEVLWYTSVFLETFAIFPQIQFTIRSRYVGSSLLFYVGLLACFRTFYVAQWAYQFLALEHIGNYVVVATGIVQFVIYCSYFVWMIVIFKTQYVNLESQIIIQPDVLTIVQANGTEDAKKIEPLDKEYNLYAVQNKYIYICATQFLYMMVYATRYLDLFTVFISIENTILKVLYIILGYCTLLTIFLFFRKTYEHEYDTFRIERLIIPCLAMAMLVNYEFETMEVLWQFSMYLEAVAMVPQFHFIAKAKYIHKHMLYYIMALATYKALYIVHWIYRYYERNQYDRYTQASGVIQLMLYCDFFIRVIPKLSLWESLGERVIVDDNSNDYDNDDKNVANVENGDMSNSGHLSSNISTIVLTPAILATLDCDKENLLKE
ncbi:uncharacterized protein LOC111642874 [Copidosoma floridanum]|uniref:uncharacterized protein LOC111642874 n=1 Tax=Copidosoma floridanum TaxID=29053 RepID=UPI000C6FC91D|nr:uncharacterized protein LOC111642874 [Copidosoma floridanum]